MRETMAYFELENENLRIRVCSKGAELQSIYAKALHTEYIWQPGTEIFPHHTMLLFPNPGRIARDRVIIGGQVYPARMHGFLNDMDFSVLSQSGRHLVLEKRADPYTRQYFPYEFALRVEFTLEDGMVRQQFHVANHGDGDLYYCLGAHPGFYCPIVLGESAEDYVLEFDCPQNLNLLELEENTRLLTGNQTPYLQAQRDIPLHEHFFDGGPLLFSGLAANTVTLRSLRSGRFVEMGIGGFESLCLWGNPTKMAVICVEPWCGTSDRTDTDHIWEHKPGIRKVTPHRVGEHQLTFRIG